MSKVVLGSCGVWQKNGPKYCKRYIRTRKGWKRISEKDWWEIVFSTQKDSLTFETLNNK